MLRIENSISLIIFLVKKRHFRGNLGIQWTIMPYPILTPWELFYKSEFAYSLHLPWNWL